MFLHKIKHSIAHSINNELISLIFMLSSKPKLVGSDSNPWPDERWYLSLAARAKESGNVTVSFFICSFSFIKVRMTLWFSFSAESVFLALKSSSCFITAQKIFFFTLHADIIDFYSLFISRTHLCPNTLLHSLFLSPTFTNTLSHSLSLW